MRIGLDVDGVLSDFNTEYMALVNKLFKKKYPIEEAKNWHLHDTYKDFTPDMEKKAFEVIGETPSFWLNLRPFDKESMKELAHFCGEHEHNVYFITNRYPTPRMRRHYIRRRCGWAITTFCLRG